MNFEEMIQNAIENFFASIPETIVVILIIIYYLKGIKGQTLVFPDIVGGLKTNLLNKFAAEKEEIQENLNMARTEIKLITNTAISEIKETFGQQVIEMKEEISMYKEILSDYKDKVLLLKQQINMQNRYNLVYIDAIAELLGENCETVRNGIATVVSKKLNMTKEELLKLPEQLITELPQLRNSMEEALTVIGQEEFDKLLESIGYVRQEEK